MRSGHASHANRAGEAAHATLRRDDDDEPMCIHRVDGNDFRESLLHLNVERRARVDGHHIVDLGPRLAEVERLENGSRPMIDLVDLDDGHRPRARVVPGEFAEGPSASRTRDRIRPSRTYSAPHGTSWPDGMRTILAGSPCSTHSISYSDWL